ncbi:MAG: hypothetical protein HY074_04760, partial [Deltaproteobacteria bacterium]|nr:hypothetical protein [Deltaproteobacteria bacterium]
MTLPASRKLLWPLLLFSALAVAACWPLLTNLHNLGFHDDWDQHFLYLAVPIDTVSRYFEWPSWNPYEFGGNPLFGHPENRFLSPFTPLYFALGPVIAVKLEFAGHLLIAMLGTFALARHFKLTRPSSILAASVFALGQSHLVQFREGHAWFMAFAYLPLAVLFFLRSLASPRNIPMVAAALALMVFEGGIYSAPLTLLALGFLLALASAAARRS